MPIGGQDGIGWDETAPADSSSAGLGDDHMRSIKTSVRQLVGAEHVFSSGGGNAQGVHLPGSARMWFGAQSAVSSSGTDGRLYWASDTSKLFHPGSGGTCLIGAGPLALSVGSFVGITFPQRSHLVMELGQGITSSSGSTLVTIPNSGYSGLPFLQVTSIGGPTLSGPDVKVQCVPVDGVTFVVNSLGDGIFLSGITFHWQSIGSRAL